MVCFSLFGGKISCRFTGCILQIFSVDVDIDVNTNFYLNTLDSGSLDCVLTVIYCLPDSGKYQPVYCIDRNNHIDQTELLLSGYCKNANLSIPIFRSNILLSLCFLILRSAKFCDAENLDTISCSGFYEAHTV